MQRRNGHSAAQAAMLMIASLGFACGDDDGAATGLDAQVPAPTGAASDAGVADAGASPLYAVSTTVFGPDTSQSFVFVVPSLGTESDALIDRAKVREFPGSSRAYGPEKAGVVYLTSDENGTMTELKFGPNAEQTVGRTVSFAQLGVTGTSGGNVNVFISPTKAYHVNQFILEVVVWNPQEMTVTKTIPLQLTVAPGYAYRAFGHIPLLVGDKLLLASNSWKSGTDGLASDSALVVVNTTTDTLESVTPETRCTGLFQYARASNGDIYFATNTNHAAQHFKTPMLAPAPCVLRIKAGATAYDPTFQRTLTADVGSQLWGSFVQGPGDQVLTRVAPVTAPAIAAAATAGDVNGADVWEWWTTRPDGAPARKLDALPVGSGSTQTYTVDAKPYVVSYETDKLETTVIDITAPAGPTRGLTVPGYVYNIIRIR
ncbi:MAG: hypothetical protein ABW252_01010 [Polyangiales bacterium]